MSDLISRVVQRSREAAMVPFDPQRILQVKKDLEMFVKNKELLDTEEKYNRLQKAIRTWDGPLRKEYDGLMRSLYDIAFEQGKDEKAINRQVEVWRKKLSPLFQAFVSVGLPPWEYWSTEPHVRGRWAEILQKIIKQLPDVAKFLEGLRKRRKIVPEVSVLTEQRVNISGFPAKLVGFDPDEADHKTTTGLIEKGLEIYKSRAPKVSPRLPKSIPLTLRFDTKPSLGGALGTGGTSGMELYPNNLTHRKPVEIAKTIAHEMGHYVYNTVLSTQDQAFWRSVINGDLGDLDLRSLLKQWPGNDMLYTWAKKVQTSDPIFSLQLMALATPTNRHLPGDLRKKFQQMDEKEGIEAYLNDGGKPVIKMPLTPISGYATTNPEEAFCEVLGYLVAYGSRTVHPKVVSWMKMILPGMKTATVSRVLQRVAKDKIPGGLADKGPPKDLDPKQLEKGIKVEMEHTDDKEIAREISYDHLTEDPEYYDKLEKVEKEACLPRTAAAEPDHLWEEYEGVLEEIKERRKFVKEIDKVLVLLRSLTECLESRALAKNYSFYQECQGIAEQDAKDLQRIAQDLLKEDQKLAILVKKGEEITFRDTRGYEGIRQHAVEVSSRLWNRWQKIPNPYILEDQGELKSRKFSELERALGRVPSPEDFSTLADDWNPRWLVENLNASSQEFRTAVKTKPSYPHLTDTQEPTNISLWKEVLDVAEGKKRELRIGDRTIHSPNNGTGYRDMPANPKGIAWAVKQYNGFGGAWRGRAASRLPKEKDMVLRVVKRHKVASGAGISYDELEQDLQVLFKTYQVYVRQSQPMMDYLGRCAKLLRNTDLNKDLKDYQENLKEIQRVLKSIPGALKAIRDPKRTPNWHDFAVYSRAGYMVANQRDMEGLVYDELWDSPLGNKLASRIKILPFSMESALEEIHYDMQRMKGKKSDEWGWR